MYVGLSVRPPMYPTRVEITPAIWRKVTSTPQKQPAANVAFAIEVAPLDRPFDNLHGFAASNSTLDDETSRKSRGAVAGRGRATGPRSSLAWPTWAIDATATFGSKSSLAA